MSPLSTTLEIVIDVVHVVGLPALFVVFVLKGALVGKVFPTSVVLSGYVVAIGPTYLTAAVIVVLVTVAHVIGQFVVYGASKRYGTDVLTRLPCLEIDPDSDQFRRIEDWFARYGGLAVFVTNVIPWSRGLIAVPAGVSDYPSGRYFVHVGSSTLLYHAVYVTVPLVGLAILT
ncbi:VTT domain-containing protein [Natronolimnohabitans sp. A-GB9]|uniref:DedA family protein n=1 Tax=Natronolimnohabitans sp. A-GB9 TaxID=3069757 RepID=UPI0027B40085|nr:VTT domain-containing protein [Natronolimnohabitans sp. A-GB9]MDQ2049919.1 VTT domain-containing protein [Natronolimnohabitans sp. A-GB9]